jgi:uncharacterized protein with FMN-binding domain
MGNSQRRQETGWIVIVRKYLVSAFVVLSFAAYAIHERSTGSSLEMDINAPRTSTATLSAPSQPQASDVLVRRSSTTPLLVPTATNPPMIPTATSQGRYVDGTYNGDITNAFYGLVQVQVTVGNGEITDVQFLDYPHDRRLSQRINEIAMPYLRSEAIQAQSARVNIISGATLTSEAFAHSLQTALNQAANSL